MPHLKLNLESSGGLLVLAPEIELDGAIAIFSTRVRLSSNGPKFCNYGYFGVPGARATRKALCESLDLPPKRLTVADQRHTGNVAIIDEKTSGLGGLKKGTGAPSTDAQTTSLPRTPLAVVTADCVPVLLFDPAHRAIAAVHAGWRSSAAGIIINTIEAMRRSFGTNPADITALIGPHIGSCCYEVGIDVAKQVAVPEAIEHRDSSIFLDLGLWNTALLRQAGMRPADIHLSRMCTACHTELLYSYRADKKKLGSNLSLIALSQ